MNYIWDTIFLGWSLFSIVYIMYGRKNNRSLIGGYKPGKPGYEAFRKLVRLRILVAVCAVALVSGIVTIFDALAILHSKGPHSILVAAPIGFVVVMTMGLLILPPLFGKK